MSLVLEMLLTLLFWLMTHLKSAKSGDLTPSQAKMLGTALYRMQSIFGDSARLGVDADTMPAEKASADMASLNAWLARPSLPDPSDVASLRNYELTQINTAINGFFSGRLLSQTDKDVMLANYGAVQEADAVTDGFLAKVVGKLPK